MQKGFSKSHPGPEEAFSPCSRRTPATHPAEPVLHGRVAPRTGSPGTVARVQLLLLVAEHPVRSLPVSQQIRACWLQSQNEAH